MKSISSFLFIFLLSTSKSWSAEVIDMGFSVQDLGRGGVHIPRETDAAVMYYNPAMLAYMSGIRLTAGSVQAGINSPSNLSLVQTSPPNQSNLSQYYGKNMWAGADVQSTLAVPYFGVGAIGKTYLDFMASNPSLPQVDVTEFVDYGVVVGGAFNLSKDISFGVNLKRISRVGGSTVITASQLANLNINTIQNAVTNSGTGYGVDAGVIWKPQNVLNLTTSIAWQDIGYTSFNAAAGSIAPPPIYDNLVLGITTQQSVGGFGWAAGFEYRHIRNDPIDITKKAHIGAEIDLGIIDLRGGFYQGWPSYGASVDLWFLTLDAAKYTVERGAYSGQNGEDRYQVGVSLEFAFDPSFALAGVGNGRKNHKLKVRR